MQSKDAPGYPTAPIPGHTGLRGEPGVAGEDVAEEAIAYRASTELPNHEDLPTTEAYMTGHDMPDIPVAPDVSPGGGDGVGLARDSGMVRRNEAGTNADEDIYSDFPDQPGGINPDSPAA